IQATADETFERLGTGIEALRAAVAGSPWEADAVELAEAYAAFQDASARLAEIGTDDFTSTMAFFAEEVTPQLDRMAAAIDGLLEQNEANASANAAAANDAFSTGRTTVYVVAGAALLLGFGLALLLSRIMSRSAGRVVTVLEAVAAGDLTQRAE